MTKNIYLYISSIDHLLKTFSIDQLLQTTRTLNSNLFNLGLPKEVLYWEEYFGESFDGIVSRIEELESDSRDEFNINYGSSIGILRSEIESNDRYYGFKSILDNVSLAILIQAQIDFGMNELQRRAQEEYDIQQDCEYNE